SACRRRFFRRAPGRSTRCSATASTSRSPRAPDRPVAPRARRRYGATGGPDVNEPAYSARKQRAIDLCREYLMPARVAAWENLGVPLVIGRREGYRIWDLDGHELIDVHLNGGTFNLGHRPPE